MAVRSKDHYQILGVGRNATQAEIKAAYRKLARKFHPDYNPGKKDAEERFKDIQGAYDVLSDPEKRRKYDQFGADWEKAGQGFTPPPGWEYRTGGAPFDFDFGLGAGGFEEIFEQLRGRGRKLLAAALGEASFAIENRIIASCCWVNICTCDGVLFSFQPDGTAN